MLARTRTLIHKTDQPCNPQIIRDPFPDNMIPENLINPAAAWFLQKYAAPEYGNGNERLQGMTMMGVPTVIGAGVDCNNYIDVRNEHHVTDQGTIRIDHNSIGATALGALFHWHRGWLHAPESSRVRCAP